MEEEIKAFHTRRRVNLKQTAKGKLYFEVCIETFGKDNVETINELDDLKKKIEERFDIREDDGF